MHIHSIVHSSGWRHLTVVMLVHEFVNVTNVQEAVPAAVEKIVDDEICKIRQNRIREREITQRPGNVTSGTPAVEQQMVDEQRGQRLVECDEYNVLCDALIQRFASDRNPSVLLGFRGKRQEGGGTTSMLGASPK